MKRLLLLSLCLGVCLTLSLPASGQVFWEDNFEGLGPNMGGGDRNAPNHTDVDNGTGPTACGSATGGDYFVRTDCNAASGSGLICSGISDMFTGLEGNFMWRGEDLDGCTADPDQIDFTGIDITGRSNITFKGLFACDDDVNEWEGPISTHPDYIEVLYQVDAGGYTRGIIFRSDASANAAFGDDRGVFRVDTDDDGFGDGPVVMDKTFREFSFSIPTTGTTLDLRVVAFVDSGGEEFAFDLFQLDEVAPSTICPTVGAVSNSETDVCPNEAFNVTATGLVNMDMTSNMDQDFGIEFVAFNSAPADPYVGGTSLGTITFGGIRILLNKKDSQSLPACGRRSSLIDRENACKKLFHGIN